MAHRRKTAGELWDNINMFVRHADFHSDSLPQVH